MTFIIQCMFIHEELLIKLLDTNFLSGTVEYTKAWKRSLALPREVKWGRYHARRRKDGGGSKSPTGFVILPAINVCQHHIKICTALKRNTVDYQRSVKGRNTRRPSRIA